MAKLRVCPRCALAKPARAFYARPNASYCRVCFRAYVLEWRRRFPDRRRAHRIVEAALKNGEIGRPATCKRCREATRYLVAHHEDYAKPLAVSWLCNTCHAIRHAELKRAARCGQPAPPLTARAPRTAPRPAPAPRPLEVACEACGAPPGLPCTLAGAWATLTPRQYARQIDGAYHRVRTRRATRPAPRRDWRDPDDLG